MSKKKTKTVRIACAIDGDGQFSAVAFGPGGYHRTEKDALFSALGDLAGHPSVRTWVIEQEVALPDKSAAVCEAEAIREWPDD